MLIITYYNWNGTVEEMYKWEEEQKKHWDKVEGVKLVGMYTPSIPWNRAWVFKTDSFDLVMKNWGGRTDNIRNTDLVILTE